MCEPSLTYHAEAPAFRTMWGALEEPAALHSLTVPCTHCSCSFLQATPQLPYPPQPGFKSIPPLQVQLELPSSSSIPPAALSTQHWSHHEVLTLLFTLTTHFPHRLILKNEIIIWHFPHQNPLWLPVSLSIKIKHYNILR